MRVLHVGNLLIAGGVERRKLSLFRRLAAPDFYHRIIFSGIQDYKFAEHMRNYVVAIDEIGCPESIFKPYKFKRVAEIIDEWRPDVIHGSIIDGYTLASVVGRLKKTSVVLMEETSDPQNRRWKAHLLARAMAGLADHCIGVSPGVGRYLTDTIHVPRSKVSVINNGVELPDLPDRVKLAELRAKFGIEKSDFIIGSVGRMADETHKRFGDLIQTIASLSDLRHVKLLLVGDGSERNRLERLAKELGVRDRVIFAGYQFIVGHFLGLMDVFALASEREAFGLVNAEAMRCGLPVVATRVGGIPDVVVHGETGFLVGARDTEAMASAFRRLIADPELRSSMGVAGKRRADREFSAESYVNRVHQLYERLWQERRR